ncbi:hypothetical protein HDE_07739 [Halotydeus destructor]|nr:hypothetical protein HDE_07739 [Halotydeus destructor]
MDTIQLTDISPPKPQVYLLVRRALLILLVLEISLILGDTIYALSELKGELATASSKAVIKVIAMRCGVPILSIIFPLIGFVGTWREHYCMTKNFAVCTLISDIVGLVFIRKMNLFQLINYFLCWVLTALAFYVTKQLVKFKRPVTDV